MGSDGIEVEFNEDTHKFEDVKLTMEKLRELTKDNSLILRNLIKKTGLNALELTDKIEAGEISIDILDFVAICKKQRAE